MYSQLYLFGIVLSLSAIVFSGLYFGWHKAHRVIRGEKNLETYGDAFDFGLCVLVISGLWPLIIVGILFALAQWLDSKISVFKNKPLPLNKLKNKPKNEVKAYLELPDEILDSDGELSEQAASFLSSSSN